MLPGKKMTIEEALRILRRRYWLVLVPFAVISAATALVARRLENVYEAKVKILVVPARVPEAFVKSTVTMRIQERLQQISQTILSRTRLEQMIRDFDLYAEERKTMIMEDVADRMRNRDVRLTPTRAGDSFEIAFRGSNPRTVMKVTEALGSAFINESLKDREGLADLTSLFMETSLDDTRRKLQELETRLADYRMKYSGQLPSQLDANLGAVGRYSTQATQLGDSIRQDRTERMTLQQQLMILESPDSTSAELATAGAAVGGVPSAPLSPAAQELKAATARLATLQTQFADIHPDVKAARKRVEQLTEQVDAENLSRPVSSAVPLPKLSPAELAKAQRIKNVQDQIARLDGQIAVKEEQEKQIRGLIANVQQRIDVVPARESEMQELTRDHQTMMNLYSQQLAKKEEARIAATLERRQIGEQFKPLDSATLPQKPVSPNRPMITFLGMVAGLVLGVGLVALLEYRDGSFKTDDEIVRLLTLPVLAVVPVMESDEDRRHAARRRLLIGLGLGSTVAGCLAILAYTLVR